MTHDYIVTHSGTQIFRSSGTPTFEDIALSLSRQPRFAGMTRKWWSVLDHSLFVALLVEGGRFGGAETLRAALLHDAHEIMGDIPTPFKTGEQKELQKTLDKLWWGTPNLAIQNVVANADKRALVAEAMVVGPPIFEGYRDVEQHFGFLPNMSDVNALLFGLQRGSLGVNPTELSYGVGAKNVRAFLKKIKETE